MESPVTSEPSPIKITEVYAILCAPLYFPCGGNPFNTCRSTNVTRIASINDLRSGTSTLHSPESSRYVTYRIPLIANNHMKKKWYPNPSVTRYGALIVFQNHGGNSRTSVS